MADAVCGTCCILKRLCLHRLLDMYSNALTTTDLYSHNSFFEYDVTLLKKAEHYIKLLHMIMYRCTNLNKRLIMAGYPRPSANVIWFVWIILVQVMTELWYVNVNIIINMTEPLVTARG